MDPASIIGALSAAGGIVALIINTAKKLSELKERFNEADITIRLLMSELLTVRSALQQVDDWTRYNLTPASPIQDDLRGAFDISLEGCSIAMELLADEVDELLGNDTGEAFQTRVKQLWSDSMMKRHQQTLHTQVAALQLLLQAVQIRSLPGQAAVLREPKHQKILDQVRDDTSSLRPIAAARSTRSRPFSMITRTESTVGSTVFPFDREITSTEVYQRNGTQAVGRREEQRAQFQRIQVNNRSSHFPEYQERISSTATDPLQWQKPQPFQRSPPMDRLSRPILNVSVSDTSLPVREKFATGIRGLFRSRNASHSFSASPSQSTLSPSTPTTPGARRGRRRSENDMKRSIDLSSTDGFSVPPIIRAAQEGSRIEVEELLDQGANVDTIHARSGRTPLAIAAHCGHDDIVALLLQHGARIDIFDAISMAPIHLAASRGHYQVVDQLLKEGANVDLPGPGRKTALRFASENGYQEVAQLLLQSRAKVNARCMEQRTALHASSKSGDEAMVRLLIVHSADVEAKDAAFMSALHYASEGNHASIVEMLLNKKANIDASGKESMTPLMCACASGSNDVVKLLLKKKASLRQKSDGGMTVLHWASYNGHDDILDLLLQKRVSVDQKTTDGRTPLHVAALSRNFSVAELLVRRGAAIEVPCFNSKRPLHYACEAGALDLVQLLLGSNADIEAETNLGRRPIHIATNVDSVPIVELLLSRGAAIDSFDAAGERPLSLASAAGNVELVQLLLTKGAGLRLKFSSGASYEDSPLCLAAKYGHLPVVLELTSRNSSVRQKDEQNWQPLRYAAYYGHPDVVEYLIGCGASISNLNQGGWGFNMTASRIGFANGMGITEDRKDRVLEILNTAEVRERTMQEATAAKDATPGVMYKPVNEVDLAELDQNQEYEIPEMPTRQVPDLPNRSAPDLPIRPVPTVPANRDTVAAIAALSSHDYPIGMQYLATEREREPPPQFYPSPSPYDPTYTYTQTPYNPASPPQSTSYYPTSNPQQQNPIPAPQSYSYDYSASPRIPSFPTQDSANTDPESVDLDSIRELRCDNCKVSGKPVPDLTCTECRRSVFRFSHAKQTYEGPKEVYEMAGSS